MKNSAIKLFVLLICMPFAGQAQQVIYSDNFSAAGLNSNWHIITGNWKIDDVQEMRIAPAEAGPYVLCGEASGLIRLIVDLPANLAAKKIQVAFSYYTYAKGPGASLEAEFHKRGQMDGMKGKLFKANLPVKGRWVIYKRTLNVPTGANALYLVFAVNKSSAVAARKVCFDVITISTVK